MGLRVLTRNTRHAANIYETLMAVKGRAPFKDAYKSLIGTVVPASAPTMGSACDHSSSWHMTCWGAAAAAFLGATATVALAETAESAAPPTADKVGLSFSFHLSSLPPCLGSFPILNPSSPFLSLITIYSSHFSGFSSIVS